MGLPLGETGEEPDPLWTEPGFRIAFQWDQPARLHRRHEIGADVGEALGRQTEGWRYYFRRYGIRTALPGIPGSTEFMEAYAAQLRKTPKVAELRPATIPGSLAALAIRYYGSPQYQSLSVTSRSNYRRVIDGFLQQHGHRQ